MKFRDKSTSRILIVDDQPDNLYVLRRLLRGQGYSVLEAAGGAEALDLAGRQRPDLILLDVMMPEMDGFEVVQRLREDAATHSIPVVLLTANAPDERLKIQGLNLGADEYLTQPINNNELLARVEALLRTKHAQDELLTRNAQLSALLDIVQASTSTLELAEVGRRLIERTLSTLAIEAGGIWLRDGDTLVCLAQRGYSAAAVEDRARIPLDASRVSVLAMERRQPIFGPTSELYGPQSAMARETRTTVVLPLLHRGEAHGVLHLGTTADRTFEGDQLAFLGAIANAAAVAVQNARLFEKSQLQRLQLQQLDLEKDEFISIIAHELKNPLASIKGYAGLLQRRGKKDGAPPLSFKGLDVIEQQANRMNLLLDQLRDVSQIGMDRFEIEPAVIDMVELTQRVALDMQATTSSHRLLLDVSVNAQLLASVDEFRMAQVLANLIGNAIKYSPDGGDVEIVVGSRDKPPCVHEHQAATWVTVTVKDGGIGIPADVQDRLFQRFFRAPNARGRISGMGLGLYITREIIQRHGGCMWLESEEGNGSLFGIALPLVAEEPGALPDRPEPAVRQEDNVANGWQGDGKAQEKKQALTP